MSPENREQTQALIDDLWQEVRKHAAEVAKTTPEKIDAMAANLEIISADDAKKAGLIHETIYADVLEDRMRAFTVGKDNELELVEPNQLLKERRVFTKHSKSGKKIAVLFAGGEISSGEAGQDQIGSDSFREDVRDIKADEDVSAVVVRVNSPGGSALASDVIWRELRALDDEMPVVISMGDMAASGGYYMSAAGRYIFAEPTTITGSIGVFGILLNAEKFLHNKVNVNFDRVVTHPYADLGSYSRSMQPKEQATIQKQVENTYRRFLDVVQDGRGFEKREDLEAIAEGRVWTGARAKEIGLVDELGGLDKAIAKASEFASLGTDYDIEVFPLEREPFRELIDRFSNDVTESWLGPIGAKNARAVAHELRSGLRSGLNLKPGVYMELFLNPLLR